MPQLSAIILAGGQGSRMKLDKPKPMAEVLGKPMLSWVIDAVKKGEINSICIVKGYKKECIEQYAENLPFEVETVFQAERLGTGHAVMMAKDFLTRHKGDVVILNGDAPFMDTKTIMEAYKLHSSSSSSATVISARVENPAGYGRIVRDGNNTLQAIVEQKDADEKALSINEVNSGGYWFKTADLLSVLDLITSDNQAKEYYLPDAVKLLLQNGKTVCAYTASSADTVLGANDLEQLAQLNNIAKEKYSHLV